ncbi:MAG TPA: hypothetical protein VFV30_07640 [Novosphingobium sp.]|nr:hypothetical protein [Novosphingobium sp.]
MRLPSRSTRRGQPLTALAIILVIWVGARTALWAGSRAPEEAAAASEAGKAAPSAGTPAGTTQGGSTGPALQGPATAPVAPQTEHALPPLVAPETEAPRDPQTVPPRIAGGHQLLLNMALSGDMPQPDQAAATTPLAPAPASPPVPYLPHAGEQALRWSADGWILWREGGNGFNLPGAGLPGASLPSGSYGSSQAGFILRYRLAPDSPLRPTLYLRASSGLYQPRGEELAAGLALRPVRQLPVALMAEARVTRTPSGTVVRPAAALVSEVPPVSLPLGFRAETYAQAGWVGGKDHTPFFDGQARIDRPVARSGKTELRLGAGAWGGAQRGANRLDIGPSATLDLPVGPARTRLSADYRFRVAGDAAPGSGVAATFSAGF